jgi:hypothetical protein
VQPCGGGGGEEARAGLGVARVEESEADAFDDLREPPATPIAADLERAPEARTRLAELRPR